MLKGCFAAAAMFLALVSAEPARAQEATLTITDGRQSVAFTRDQLANMKQEVIETTAPKMQAAARFSGPTFTTVLTEAGLAGETVEAAGRDGYRKAIPRERLTADGAIVAISMDDEPLPEGKAPFWIIFPYDKAPEMNDREHHSWSVYQLTTLTVKAGP